MPKIKNSCIEEIRSRVNIYDLASTYTSLKKSGSSYKGLSPFTAEKSPSFFVHPDKNFFHCFSTSQGGDIFKLVMLKEAMNFPDAVEFIANRFGIQLEYEQGEGGPRQNSSLKKQLYDIHEEAAAEFEKNFWAGNAEAAEMRRYWLEERGFTEADAKAMRIGYAEVSEAGLKKRLQQKGYSFEAIKASGIFFLRDTDRSIDRARCRFKGRLMIPIADHQGRIVAFTARKTSFTLSDIPYEEGKYVNSPETDIFKKNAVLFNFDKARKAAHDRGCAIIVEGQIDAMRMYCSGFENTVASQGTALGLEQLALVKRCTDTAILLFDADAAGAKASARVIPLCIRAELSPLVVRMEDGNDPDTFIKNSGREAMENLLKNRAQNPMSFCVSQKLKENPNPSPMQKSAMLEEMFEAISYCRSRTAEDGYLMELSVALTADYSSVKRDYASWKRRRGNSGTDAEETPEAYAAKNTGRRPPAMLTNAAYDALIVCLNYEKLADALSHAVEDEWIDSDDESERLLRKLLALHREGIGLEISELETHIGDKEELRIIYEILLLDKNLIENPIETANRCVLALFRKYCLRNIEKLNRMLADPAKSLEEQMLILKQIGELRARAKTPPQEIK